MKITLFLICFLIGCSSTNNSCNLPMGEFTFIFNEIEGDCGELPVSYGQLSELTECTDITELQNCIYHVYDECEDSIHQLELDIISSKKVEGIMHIDSIECSGLYNVVGVK